MTSDIIARLENAPEGSRELEREIATLINWREKGVNIREHQQEFPAASLLHWGFPRWTRSLDAKLPGEDIRSTKRQANGTWLAHQDGYQGHAHTEVLARRIAALKSGEATPW